MTPNQIELVREPIPDKPYSRGQWRRVLEAAREASANGECVRFAGGAALANAARQTLYSGGRYTRPEEKVHVSWDSKASVVRVWITRSES